MITPVSPPLFETHIGHSMRGPLDAPRQRGDTTAPCGGSQGSPRLDHGTPLGVEAKSSINKWPVETIRYSAGTIPTRLHHVQSCTSVLDGVRGRETRR